MTIHPDVNDFSGYHAFEDESGEPYGSFEIFYLEAGVMAEEIIASGGKPLETGWYWHPCFPGYLPDGEPNGPFATSHAAYEDAWGAD